MCLENKSNRIMRINVLYINIIQIIKFKKNITLSSLIINTILNRGLNYHFRHIELTNY